MIRAIDTRFAGRLFRSRLEARWAVFFDSFGLRYEYEPEGFTLRGGIKYLPDFYLPQIRMWAEVKPEQMGPREIDKCGRLSRTTRRGCLLLEGPPEDRAYLATEPDHVAECDYCWTRQYLHESRLYASPGCDCAWSRGPGCEHCRIDSAVAVAVAAANEARFEHGAMPSTLADLQRRVSELERAQA